MTPFLALALILAAAPADDGLVEDFEGAVLDGWERVRSDAHPPYNTIELALEPQAAKSGRQFVRLRTQGGRSALTRKPWPIDATLPYRLSVHARLTGTRRNAAIVTLTWLNRDGERIGELRSAPMSQPGGWTELSLDLGQVPAGAASAMLRLDFDGDDVRGECDFDLLSLRPVVRLDLKPEGRPFAVYTPDECPRFTVSLAGAAPGTHGITLALDSGLRRSVVLDLPSDRVRSVDFPALKPGAYEMIASIDGSDVRRSLTLLVPNPWMSPPLPGEGILALAGVSATAGASNGTLEELLRRRLADPSSPVAAERPFIDSEGRPTPALLALRVTTDVLRNAVPVADPGLFPAGVRVAAFRTGNSAALALWSESGGIELPVSLNDGARLYPLGGAIRPLKPGERLTLGPLPTFLIGVDPLLLELRLELKDADLPLQAAPVTRTLRLANPARSQVLRDVRVRIEELPAGWRVAPREMSVATLAAEAALDAELQITLPASEHERTQELKFAVTFVRDGKEQRVVLSRIVALRSAIAIHSAVKDGPMPGSRAVTVRITNASDRPMTIALRARIPRHPEQMELLRSLAPGGSSGTFEYVVKDVDLLDPTRRAAEIDVQESVAPRSGAHKVIPLR